MGLRQVLLISLLAFAAAQRPQSYLQNRLNLRKTYRSQSLTSLDIDSATLYPAYNLSVPVDHFHNDTLYEPHSGAFFPLRYWFDASHYEPGGPVIVLQGGETSGTDRLPFLQKGILAQLARATHGIGVVLEHRYYGTSFPVSDLSTASLRFLTTDQALADEAYFARHVVFEGLEHVDLTAGNVAYIGYGGSYAGAMNAFLRKLYPDVFWGAISSSGVTEAVHDYWQYYEPIREYGPSDCISTQQKFTDVVDGILIGRKGDAKTVQQLKAVFGLENLTSNQDFAAVLAIGLEQWQNKVWDPAVNDPSFDYYCRNITSDNIIYPETKSLATAVGNLIQKSGYKKELRPLTIRMLNYIGYLNLTLISTCTDTPDSCFSTNQPSFLHQDDISQTWRSWPYQFCTQWGYFQTGSGVPDHQLPLISRVLDLEFTAQLCRLAFNITTPPDIDAINKYGGYALSYPRLAIVDGEWDPWRPATPHASPFVEGVRNRTSTVEEPFVLIEGGVHHWDEYGLFVNETGPGMPPRAIVDVQELEVRFVKAWMEEWSRERSREEELRR